MGQQMALVTHILGTIFAGVFIYFVAPYIASFITADEELTYLVLYALLAVSSFKTAQKIEEGKDEKTNELDELLEKKGEHK
ncbi:hypothetical protein [Aeromonas rivipollensis]|uniref:hypothetical protein n=1 Tax=Aeromonas rivipollensis TaxID=948519 RepID=UPI000F97A1B9